VTDYKQTPPEDRTIVPGVWSDLLDRCLDSFTNDETGKPAIIEKIDSIVLAIESLTATKETLDEILIELRIQNKYNQLGHDEIIDEESVHEDRRR